jgi:hypothetical protein
MMCLGWKSPSKNCGRDQTVIPPLQCPDASWFYWAAALILGIAVVKK